MRNHTTPFRPFCEFDLHVIKKIFCKLELQNCILEDNEARQNEKIHRVKRATKGDEATKQPNQRSFPGRAGLRRIDCRGTTARGFDSVQQGLFLQSECLWSNTNRCGEYE